MIYKRATLFVPDDMNGSLLLLCKLEEGSNRRDELGILSPQCKWSVFDEVKS